MIRNYLKIALRNLARNKVYSFINIVGLALGLAVAMLIALYVKDENSYDRFHEQKANLYRIVVDERSPGKGGMPGELFSFSQTGMMPGPEFKAETPEIQAFVRVSAEVFNLKKGTEVLEQEALIVDKNFFDLFSFRFVDGNASSAFKSPESVVISEEIAQKYFGKSRVVGQKLTIFDKEKTKDYVVGAVTETSPQNSSIKIKLLLPLTDTSGNNWVNFYLNTFVLLSPGANIAAVERKMAKIYASKAAAQLKEAHDKWGYKNKITYKLQPLLGMHLSTEYQGGNGLKDASNPVFSYILSGIAVLLLLIACINFVNLTVARSIKRGKEIGIRKVVGGQRKELVRQFMGESFLLTTIAFVLAWGLVEVFIPFFNTLSNKALSISYLLDLQFVAFCITLFALTGFLAGIYPALVLSGYNPVQTLYGRFQLSGKNLLQKSLVVFQFALTTFFIATTVIVYQQFEYLTTVNLGYNDEHLVQVNAHRMSSEKVNLIRNELLRSAAVERVAPKNWGNWYTIAKINNGQETSFHCNVIDANYLPTFQIPIVAGRNFSASLATDSSKYILVNEKFAKDAGWKKPIGQKLDFFMRKHVYEVVGVVKDHHFESLSSEIRRQVFFMDTQMTDAYGTLFVKLKPQQTVAGLKHIEKVFKANLPTLPFNYEFKDSQNDAQYETELKWKQIISLAALLTIFVSCIGLFGLATLAAEKRTKEIGIRKVMGASVLNITRLLSLNFLKLIVIAAVIALPVAVYVSQQWLQKYPYRIQVSAWIFVATVLVVSTLALFTVGYQAIKAATANPVKSLKTE